MNNYPDAVAKIAADYVRRVKAALHLVPAPEQAEFLREIESHLYEAYQGAQGESDVDRILTVLRNMGEPADLVADRLPGAFLRSGAQRKLPLHIFAAVLIALFGIPLGASGAAALIGVLAALVGVVIAYYATVASILLVATVFLAMGLIRAYTPGFWDRLVSLGVIHMDSLVAGFFDQLSAPEQSFFLLALAAVFAAAGIGGLWLGRYVIRGMRFLFSLAFEQIGQLAQKARQAFRRRRSGHFAAGSMAFVK
jgi:uncharacterized membrane protein